MGKVGEGEESMQNQDDLRLRSFRDESNSVLQTVESGDGESRAIERDLSTEDSPEKREEMLENAVNATKTAEVQHLEAEEELQLFKRAVEITCDDGQQNIDSHIEQLATQVEAKRLKLKELESEGDEIEKSLQEKRTNLKQSLLELYPEAYGKFTRKKEIELEIEVNLAEIKRREEELSQLSLDLAKQPKLAPRRSHIERIIEITKNSKKQDADIQRILKDTRDLQLESNSVQERLNRTYAVIDETIFREAKRDPVAQQAYRLLTSVHESFEQIAEKILATDRNRRDAANYEAKHAVISGRSMNMDKLHADLDVIRRENELLEQRLGTL